MAEQTTTTAAMDSAAGEIESKIKAALRSRVSYFREQADSLTFVGVRRLLEEDLGFDMYALDPHKKFVKTYLEQCLEAADDDQPKKEENESNTTGSQTMEDSPVLGLMTDNKKAKRGTKEKEETQNHDAPSEAEIKEAIRKRASHLKENSGSITGVGVRRLLEEDLKLDKFALDAFKKFISDQVTEVFSAPEISKKTSGDGKAKPKKSSNVKAASDSTKEEHSGSSENESEESEESAVKARKRTAPKGKVQGSAGFKRKRAEVDKNDSKRKSKVSKSKSGENSDKDADDLSVSVDDSESSAEKSVQKKEVDKPSYGKRVEHLKTVIKACGMSVPPSVYKKVKQAPENKREATLIKELEDLLQKEGLSSSPSEKEIKEVKKRKDRAKELEGIDMSNIVFSSRRRSTSSLPPPKPKSPVKNDKQSSNDDDDDGEEEEDDNEDDNDDEEVREEEEDDGDEGQDNDEDDDGNDDEDGQIEEDED